MVNAFPEFQCIVALLGSSVCLTWPPGILALRGIWRSLSGSTESEVK